MSPSVPTDVGTASYDGLDLPAALAWAGQRLGAGVVEHRELSGGMTSLMLALSDEGGGRTVLRLLTEEPWRRHGAELATRESATQAQLESSPVPAPRSLALDASGGVCGVAAHLMTLVPGRVEPHRADPASMSALAATLVDVHAFVPPVPARTYESWAWEAKRVVPPWATRPALWERAFGLLSEPPPPFAPTFLHRDYQPSNVLWSPNGAVSGVVDWVETSTGPAWLDVAHCATNLAMTRGQAPADEFAAAYTSQTGRAREPYWEVLDVVGFLPSPGLAPMIVDPGYQRRLETLLAESLS